MKQRVRKRDVNGIKQDQADSWKALPSLPFEVIIYVFQHSLDRDQLLAARLLALNSKIYRALQPMVYTRVELATSAALTNFCELIKYRPEVARMVRALWIGPCTSRSDLLSILSAPLPGDSGYIEELREEVYMQTRFVLRSCRRLQDVALSGSLVSSNVVHSYGTACQPISLTSVNPHSFVSGFDAPIFRKVTSLVICDINLSITEADAINRLPMLQYLHYTSPKDYGEIQRDIWILRKVLGLEIKQMDPVSLLTPSVNEKPARLQSFTYRSVEQKSARVLNALIQNDTERDCQLHFQLHSEPLVPAFIEQWDALRDLVFNAQEEYSRAALDDDVGTWIDSGMALEQLRMEWRTRSTTYTTNSLHSALACMTIQPKLPEAL
ncbi:hypothetical protein MPSI1_002910 [Malassezia psittaci]|uniref:Uncharacterized protein n=1 Tax=Malassezia psittaci TaxID=1821823 RepID=A0AAF0FCG8_9BASI|nr:hypothetical protein MPSI1_002910 [Malassezia psittaci]